MSTTEQSPSAEQAAAEHAAAAQLPGSPLPESPLRSPLTLIADGASCTLDGHCGPA